MRKKASHLLVMTVLALSISLFTGCGSNIFKSLESAKQKTASEAIKTGDFSSALTSSQAIIDSGATGATLQAALIDKGTAIMGQQNALPYTLLPTLKTLADNPTSANNIIKTINENLTISVANAITAADALNYAVNLSTSTNIHITGTVENIVLSPSLNASAQFRRGFANATVVIKMTTLYLDISTDPFNVTRNSTAVSGDKTYERIMEYLFTAPRTVAYYAENAVDAFQKSNVLTSSQLDVVTKLKTCGTNFKNLNAIRLNDNNGTFQVIDKNGSSIMSYSSISFSSSDNESVRNSKYRSAAEQIIQSLNN